MNFWDGFTLRDQYILRFVAEWKSSKWTGITFSNLVAMYWNRWETWEEFLFRPNIFKYFYHPIWISDRFSLMQSLKKRWNVYVNSRKVFQREISLFWRIIIGNSLKWSCWNKKLTRENFKKVISWVQVHLKATQILVFRLFQIIINF